MLLALFPKRKYAAFCMAFVLKRFFADFEIQYSRLVSIFMLGFDGLCDDRLCIKKLW